MVAFAPTEIEMRGLGFTLIREDDLKIDKIDTEVLDKLGLSDKKGDIAEQLKSAIGKEFS